MLKKSSTKIMVIAIAAAAIIGGIFIFSNVGSTPEKTILKFEKAMNKGNQKKILKLLDPEVRDMYALDMLYGDWDGSDLKVNIIIDEVIYDEEDKDIAEVYLFVTSKGQDDLEEETYYEVFDMIRVNKKWYINDFY